MLRRIVAGCAAGFLISGFIGLPAAYAGDFVDEQGSDFNCDGVRDTVTGRAYDAVGSVDNAGAVIVGLSGGTTQRLTQDSPGVPGAAEHGDRFGEIHAVYDRNSDGCDDLVIGASGEDIGTLEDAGVVVIVPGSPTGLDTTKATTYQQGTKGFSGTPEEHDKFGSTLAAGTTSGGRPYLLIGTPWEGGPDDLRAGAGVVYYMWSGGVVALTQDTPGVPGTKELLDHFGGTLSVSDRFFVIGAPGEGVGDEPSAGLVHVFSHTFADGRPKHVAAITQDTAGVTGTAERFDSFGAVSVLSYRPSPSSPIGALVAVGAPGEDVGTVEGAGMAHLLYVAPTGTVTERAALTQATAGVSDTPEEWDSFGSGVVVASLGSGVATPQTAVWSVAALGEQISENEVGAVHVFRPGWRTGDADAYLVDGTYGLPAGALEEPGVLRASASHLHLGDSTSVIDGDPAHCYAVPWSNLLNGASDPVVDRPDDCR